MSWSLSSSPHRVHLRPIQSCPITRVSEFKRGSTYPVLPPVRFSRAGPVRLHLRSPVNPGERRPRQDFRRRYLAKSILAARSGAGKNPAPWSSILVHARVLCLPMLTRRGCWYLCSHGDLYMKHDFRAASVRTFHDRAASPGSSIPWRVSFLHFSPAVKVDNLVPVYCFNRIHCTHLAASRFA